MPNANVADRVKDLIVEMIGCNPSEVVPEAKLTEDLGADSLDHVEMIMAAEEEWGIEISDEDAENLTTVGEVIKYIEGRVNAAE